MTSSSATAKTTSSSAYALAASFCTRLLHVACARTARPTVMEANARGARRTHSEPANRLEKEISIKLSTLSRQPKQK